MRDITDPVTLIGFVAAMAQRLQMSGQAAGALAEQVPEYDRFRSGAIRILIGLTEELES